MGSQRVGLSDCHSLPVLLVANGSALLGAWMAAASHCPSCQGSRWPFRRSIVRLADCQSLPLHRPVPRPHFPGIQGIRIKLTPYSFPNYFSFIFQAPPWHCFPRNYEAMKLLKNSNTMHGLFIKKTIIEKRSCKFARWKFQCREEEREMATGRVRFSPEMLTNWTEAGGEASIDTHAHMQCDTIWVLLSL